MLFVGTVCRCGTGGADVIGANADSFSLAILNPAGDAATAGFAFSQAGFPDIAIATTGTLSVVPEPATWAAMVAASCWSERARGDRAALRERIWPEASSHRFRILRRR